MVGVFGGLMALFGAVASIFIGGVGAFAGVDDAGSQASRGFGAAVMALAGIGGALVARVRLRTGASIMVVSSVLGLLLALLFYAAGAVLMLAAAAMAWLPEPDSKAG